MSITEFLTARLDEDEAVAREAALMRDRTKFLPGREPEVPDMGAWANDDVLGGAVVSVGPERVLADVEAKRRIVEWEKRYRTTVERRGESWTHRATGNLRALASVYANHPDYDEDWTP